jgi:predicted amidohydrolase YtcJ
VPADQLKDLKCEMTLLRGKEVYRAADGAISGK